MLADARLDVGVGNAAHAPPGVASELFRLDRMGVLLSERHPLAAADTVAMGRLAGEPLLFAEQSRAPEYNEFVVRACTDAGAGRPRHPAPVVAAVARRQHQPPRPGGAGQRPRPVRQARLACAKETGVKRRLTDPGVHRR